MKPTPSRQTLGYEPFEYWKGPRVVHFPHSVRRPPTAIQPRDVDAARNRQLISDGKAQGSTMGGLCSDTKGPAALGRQQKATPAAAAIGDTAKSARQMVVYIQGDGADSSGPGGKSEGYRVSVSSSASEAIKKSRRDSFRDSGKMTQRFYEERAPWYDLRAWRKRTWAFIVVSLAVIIAVVVAVVVVVSRNNRYPNYSKLNYSLADTYTTKNFYDRFQYVHGLDPTNGFVHYVDPDYSKAYNLTYTTDNSAVMKVDTTQNSTSASTGRLSVRISSKTTYDKGLFIFDVKHAPTGCGTWPALWLTDAGNWPQHGEIDVLESLNTAAHNTMSLHTSSGCSMAVKRLMGGSGGSSDCDAAAGNNQGCDVAAAGDATAGAGFNSAGGGLLALEWRPEGIRVWQWGRGSGAAPADVTAAGATPDPSSWGQPMADFPSTECDISSHFRNASITANIDLCGAAMEGGVYERSGCPVNCVGSGYQCIGSDASRNNCTDFVARNPSALKNAYWEFGTFRVYQAS